jgi:vaccinia related kinase
MPPRQPSCYQIVAPRKRNPSNSFRLQEPIRQGEVLSDVSDKKWKLGRSIGVGAFGEIYLGMYTSHWSTLLGFRIFM